MFLFKFLKLVTRNDTTAFLFCTQTTFNNFKIRIMTLEDILQKLDEYRNQKNRMIADIKDNHLDTSENRLMYNRWEETKRLEYRHKIVKKINNGEKEWEPLFEGYPVPYKLFAFADVEDIELRQCIKHLEDLEEKEHRLFLFMFATYNTPEDRKIIKEYIYINN